MFNLVGKRYLFLIISLVVIVPGVISLIIFHLNVGIDFAGGANIEFRPQNPISSTEMKAALTSFHLEDLQLVSGARTNLHANQVFWVRLNTQVDDNVKNTIKNNIQKKYTSGTSVEFDTLTYQGKNVTVASITIAQNVTPPTTSDISTLLSGLPKTTNPNQPPTTATPTASPTTVPSATATAKPTVTATATAKGTGTPTTAKGSPIPAASPTATSNPATIPVSVADVAQGSTTQTITLLTRSEIDLGKLAQIKSAILNQTGNYTDLLDNSTVSGSVAAETTRNAFLAVLAASVLILLYISISFRKVQKPWRYGTCAIIALLHDVLVVLGVFSILGWLFAVQIDALFITALLTVVGFSVHDTIVVFDRIRENMQRRTSETFEQVVNASLVQTMARSLNTSLTVLFTLSALTLFVGTNTSVRNFTLALLIGIFSGTYSSIFNASMLLVIWEKGELGLDRFNRERTADGRQVRELVRSGR